ncbi:hypothetical protein J4P02_20835 [Pseudomonas sp. NFXW11]|uniref:hypothetical protein n=1 Tax=Pseudomonas sp. NFXW11 TaxID=2819531 RepID=UPI003CF9AC2C
MKHARDNRGGTTFGNQQAMQLPEQQPQNITKLFAPRAARVALLGFGFGFGFGFRSGF